MMFEYGANACTDRHVLFRITEQVTHQPYISRLRQTDQDDDVRALILKGRMYRVPDPFIAVDVSFTGYLLKSKIQAQTVMTDKLRAPLPALTGNTALQKYLLTLQALPERFIETIRCRNWLR
jgi:hypothetical protein